MTEPQNGTVAPVSGTYSPGKLMLAFDADTRVVSGFYENHTGWDERLQSSRFSCVFFLNGRSDGESARIQTWYPGLENKIEGTLTTQADGTVKITLADEHGGCANVEPSFDEGGVSFTLRAARAGKAIAVVSSKEAFFFDEPVETQRRDSHVVRGNAVFVLESRPGWVRGASGDNEGWLQASDLYAEALPE